MSKTRYRPFLPVLFLFITINVFLTVGRTMLQKWNIDQDVLIIGNLVIFCVTLLSYFLTMRGISSTNPHAFVRFVYVSIMLKLLVCIIAALIYIFLSRSNINKPALFVCMGLYLFYTFIEVMILIKSLKQKTNV